MATRPYELTRLDPDTFEHMANQLAARVLGAGATGFGPGADGGRDGWFEGEAPYPSDVDRWNGTWYIQAKFHSPHLSKNPQQWLQSEITKELKAFEDPNTGRVWPDNWIIVSNVDPSANPKTGTHDRVINLVKRSNSRLSKRTHVWGGEKILSLLAQYPEISDYYAAFTTSGQVLSAAMQGLTDKNATSESIIRDLIVTQFIDQQFTKLDQAGSTADTRPGIHKLFVDLPYKASDARSGEKALRTLASASSENFLTRQGPFRSDRWQKWLSEPRRSKIWFIRGGPGQGKSTLTQYMCQIQRAAFIDASAETLPTAPRIAEVVDELKVEAQRLSFWPSAARIPVQIELRLYAKWYGDQPEGGAKGFLTYLVKRLSSSIEQKVLPGTLKRAFGTGRWLFVFDGLDEVPGDVKDSIATEISGFVDNVLIESRSEAMVVCTSRPQGYSGQFEVLNPTLVDLINLAPDEALECAIPVLSVDRASEELEGYTAILREALSSPAIREIMTTPLQSHIMAVVVRDGGRPPERRWQLFNNFYQVIKKREANRNLADRQVAKLLRDGDKLIKTLHNRLGFELHSRAEKSSGAQTSIDKLELEGIVYDIVDSLQAAGVEETVGTLMEATTERLVLVSTPENGSSVRFDIRPLQEFFASEYLYETAPEDGFLERLQTIAGDSHWREVLHFLLSALVEQGRRGELALAVQVLTGLDEPGSDENKYLARSLCLGGAMTARLVREGVLESDKRIRQLFQPCTPALLAATEARSLMPSVGPPHSRDWVASLISSALEDNSPQENIGAALLAPALMVSPADNNAKLEDYIIAQSINYRSAFVVRTSRYSDRQQTLNEIPLWVTRYVVRELLSDSWRLFEHIPLDAMYDILAANEIATHVVLVEFGVSEPVAEIIISAFRRDLGHRPKVNKHTKFFGLLALSLSKGEEKLLAKKWGVKVVDEMIAMPGAFGLIGKIALASEFRTNELFEQVNKAIDGNVNALMRLPDNVVSMFLSYTGPLSQSSSKLISDVIRRPDRGDRRMYLIERQESVPADWKAIASAFPSVITVHLARGYHEIDTEELLGWLQIPGSTEHVLQVFEDHQANLPNISDLPKLIEKHEPLGVGLKRLIGRRLPTYNAWDGSSHSAFEVSLPADHGLLPHLLLHLDAVYQHGASYTDASGHRVKYSLSALISEYALDPDVLKQIGSDMSLNSGIRTAALVFLLAIYPDDEPEYRLILEAIMVLIYQDDCSYALPATFSLLSNGIKKQLPAATWFANESLKAVRPMIGVRVSLESVISEWREITRSPVLSSTSAKIWV